MSWLEKVQDRFTITTGDGVVYGQNRDKTDVILWMNATKEKEFNIARFAFPGKQGELVYRGEPLATSYKLEIYFQGEDHLRIARNFDISSNDKRAWTINHPYYGNLYVQPLGLSFDNTLHNVTKITGTVVETINDDNPQAVLDYKETIRDSQMILDARCLSYYEDAVSPKTAELVSLQETTYNFYTKGRRIIKETADEEKYTNIYNEAYSAIVDYTQEYVEIMRKVQAFINAPFLFVQSIRERQEMMVSQFETMIDSIPIINGTFLVKKNLEVIGIALVSSMASLVTAALDTDFTSRRDVLTFIDTLSNTYSSFLNTLDTWCVMPTGAAYVGVYLPDSYTLTLLQNLVNFTLANTFNLLQDSKQERTVYIEDDSNAILLTHRFYGLDVDDKVMDKFIQQNNIGLNELLFIRKGRPITYYV